MNGLRKILLAALLALPLATTAQEREIDPETGLVIAENWEIVRAHCTACHSSKLVTAQRGTRQMWLNIIRWMQDTQGLWQFSDEHEDAILSYLATHYAPEGGYRRAPIPPRMMPPNPYKQTADN